MNYFQVPVYGFSMRTQTRDKLGFTSLTREGAIAWSSDTPFTAGSNVQTYPIRQGQPPKVGYTYTFTGDFFHKKFSLQVAILEDDNDEGT